MRIQLEKEDIDGLNKRVEVLITKFVNNKARELVFDFSNNLKLRKYLTGLIKEVVREELLYAKDKQEVKK